MILHGTRPISTSLGFNTRLSRKRNRYRRIRGLLHLGRLPGGQRRSMVGDQEPLRPAAMPLTVGWDGAANKNIRCLDQRLVEAPFKRTGNLLRASDPGDVPFDAHPHGVDFHLHALRARKNPHPACAHFFPSEQHVPARMDAFDPVFVQPDGVHVRQAEGSERAIEAMVRLANALLGCIQLSCRSCRHGLQAAGWTFAADVPPVIIPESAMAARFAWVQPAANSAIHLLRTASCCGATRRKAIPIPSPGTARTVRAVASKTSLPFLMMTRSCVP